MNLPRLKVAETTSFRRGWKNFVDELCVEWSIHKEVRQFARKHGGRLFADTISVILQRKWRELRTIGCLHAFQDWISRICSEASFQDFKSFASREILLVHWTFSIIARSERFCSRCCAFWWSRVDRLNWKRRARTLCIKIIVSDWNSEKYI